MAPHALSGQMRQGKKEATASAWSTDWAATQIPLRIRRVSWTATGSVPVQGLSEYPQAIRGRLHRTPPQELQPIAALLSTAPCPLLSDVGMRVSPRTLQAAAPRSAGHRRQSSG